jgi:hypothetical protein
MVSRRTSRRLAAPALIACAGVLGSAATAHAQGSGGLSVTPAILEHRAAVGGVGSMTLTNTTRETLRVTVRVRPWRQELSGRVFTDDRSTLSRYVRANRTSFRIRAGAKVPLSFRMLRRTRSGSLYGNVDVLGKPVNTRGRKGIIPQYRLISTLRLHPSRKSHRLRTGTAQVRGGQILLPVRNLGNTIDPVAGTFRLAGPTTRNGTFKGIAALPGKLIALGAGPARGLRRGRYTLHATVTQGSRRVISRTGFTIR